MSQEKKSFRATADDGQEYILYVYPVRATPSSAGLPADPSSPVQIRTSDGREVVKVRKSEYRIVQGEIELRSDDPGAV